MEPTRIQAETVIFSTISNERVWDAVTDLEAFPSFMENVDEVKIIERDGLEGVSEWLVNIEGAPFSWVEKDLFNKESLSLDFESMDGDFDKLDGSWRIETREGESKKIHCEVNYLLGIPVIEEVLGDVLKEKMTRHLQSMLDALRKKLCGDEIEKRRYRRFRIGRSKKILCQNRAVEAFVVDLSRKGALLNYHDDFSMEGDSITLGDVTVKVEKMHKDEQKGSSRVIFKDAIAAEQLNEIIQWSGRPEFPKVEKKVSA
ncbi:type II toxin-antitoxin system RatA family toxin [Fibrobacterota bacterium]